MKNRNRGRGEGPRLCALASFNSSGLPQLRNCLGHLEKKRNGALVAALFNQEHHINSDRMADNQAAFKRRGWDFHGSPAVGSGRECSAGVGVGVRSFMNSGVPFGDGHDLSPMGSAGRVSCTWLDGGLKGGVLLVSVYFWHSEGLTPRNMELLFAAGLAIKRWGGGWVMGGDFNLDPAIFADGAAAWLERIGGVVHSPHASTCEGTGGGSTLDYFVVDRRISHGVVSTTVDSDFAGSPHSIVIITLISNVTKGLHREVVRPRDSPPDLITGCLSKRATGLNSPGVTPVFEENGEGFGFRMRENVWGGR